MQGGEKGGGFRGTGGLEDEGSKDAEVSRGVVGV